MWRLPRAQRPVYRRTIAPMSAVLTSCGSRPSPGQPIATSTLSTAPKRKKYRARRSNVLIGPCKWPPSWRPSPPAKRKQLSFSHVIRFRGYYPGKTHVGPRPSPAAAEERSWEKRETINANLHQIEKLWPIWPFNQTSLTSRLCKRWQMFARLRGLTVKGLIHAPSCRVFLRSRVPATQFRLCEGGKTSGTKHHKGQKASSSAGKFSSELGLGAFSKSPPRLSRGRRDHRSSGTFNHPSVDSAIYILAPTACRVIITAPTNTFHTSVCQQWRLLFTKSHLSLWETIRFQS